MYDLVIVAESEKHLARAFADAFVGRDRRERVAVVLPPNQDLHPEFHRLRRSLELSEITIIEGSASDAGPHYLDIDGRLIYGESIVRVAVAQRS